MDLLTNFNDISVIDVAIGILSSLAVIFLTMPIHEAAHAYVATKLGDPTPRYAGRLSLNPFNHIDYMGALCIILFGFGWAKPVQVNPRNFDNAKRGMALTAFAGPLSNILLATVSVTVNMLLLKISIVTQLEIIYYISIFFYYIAVINVSLAVFNLIPIPTLDGSRFLSAFLPDRIYYRLMQYERYFYFGLIILIVSGSLDGVLSTINFKIMEVISFLPGIILF